MTTQTKTAKLIEFVCENTHLTELFSGEATHAPTRDFIAGLVRYTTDENFIKELVVSALPENYGGDTLKELPAMIRGAIKKGYDKPSTSKDADKPSSKATQLIELVENHSGIKLFHDGFGQTYISVTEEQRTKTWPLTSSAAQRWLKHQFYSRTGRAITTTAFKEAHETIISKALFDGEARPIFLRIAKTENAVLFNLADEKGRIVLIQESGWAITQEPLVAFVNSSSLGPIPAPEKGDGDALAKFKALMGLSDKNFHRVVAFIVNSLRPDGPYLALLLEGEQGSGKSLLSEFIKTIVDKGQARNVRLPDTARDLMIQAKNCHLIVFDNVSGVKGDISDALCSLSTGGGYETRKLYTDDELQIFNVVRPYILNGIDGIATRPDLMERCLSLKLPAMTQKKRLDEAELRSTFNEMMPALLGELFDIVACALRNYDKVCTPKTVRMVDAAKWLIAAEPATKLPEGALLSALETSEKDLMQELMSSDPLALALVKLVECHKGPYEGTIGELYDRIEHFAGVKHDRFFPKSPSQLSKVFTKKRKALELAGIIVEIGPKTRKGKTVKVTLADDGDFSEMHLSGGEPIGA